MDTRLKFNVYKVFIKCHSFYEFHVQDVFWMADNFSISFSLRKFLVKMDRKG